MARGVFTKEEYKELVAQASRHDQLYYQQSAPVISDYEYDLLVKEIEKIEKQYPEWIEKTPFIETITTDSTGHFKTVAHKQPMLSLANSYSEEEVEAFIHRMEKLTEKEQNSFNVELKMDGVALSVIYEDGVFVCAVTRGNGKEGDDVTENAKGIENLPHQLACEHKGVLEFRGEVYLPIAQFERLNKERALEGLELYANPRNAASGSLKLQDPIASKKRGLKIMLYDIATPPKELKMQSEIAPYLQKFGLPVLSKEFTHRAHSTKEILEFAKKIEGRRRSLPFEIDGIVVKMDDLDDRSVIGATNKSPRWAIAYKFAAEQAQTVIESICVQVGRTGVLTPVANLKPVLLSGSTISRATLHNQDEITRKDIREGDTVIIEKGGDVIPKVVSVVIIPGKHRRPKWSFPTTCPYCASAVIQNEGQVALRCKAGEKCSGQYIARMKHFVSKGAMNIENMGIKVIEKLYALGLLNNLPSIYRLRPIDLEGVEGFKQRSIEVLIENIETSKDVELSRFIFALGIPFVGIVAAKVIAELVKDVQGLLTASYEELIQLEGVGEKVASSIVEFVRNSSHIDEIKEFIRLGIHTRKISEKLQGHEFSGKSFVVTGTLEEFDRTRAKEAIESCGGKVSSSLSKLTDYLLLGKNPGSKYNKALKLNIKILTESDFKGKL